MLSFSEIVRGHTETILLAQLLSGDSYGYRINKRIKALTDGQFEFKEATLYTAFRRLEEEGLIESYWGDEATGTRRRYYKITPRGREVYAEHAQSARRYARWIDKMINVEDDIP